MLHLALSDEEYDALVEALLDQADACREAASPSGNSDPDDRAKMTAAAAALDRVRARVTVDKP